MTTEAETGMMPLQIKDAKNCQQPPEAAKRQHSLTEFLEGTSPADTPDF